MIELWIDLEEDTYKRNLTFSSLSNSFEPRIFTKMFPITSYWSLELLIIDSIIDVYTYLANNVPNFPEPSMEKIIHLVCPTSKVTISKPQNNLLNINLLIHWEEYTSPAYTIEGKAWIEEKSPKLFHGQYKMIEDEVKIHESEVFKANYLAIMLFDLTNSFFRKIEKLYQERYC